MVNNLSIQTANSEGLLKSVYTVRKEVFVHEQKVDERKEYDQYETSSKHLVCLLNNIVVGTCRYRNTEKGVKLERFAVLQEHRGKGVGEKLLQACIAQNKGSYIYLHAQVQVVDFYAKYQFKKHGERFEEAGIQHFKMVYEDLD